MRALLFALACSATAPAWCQWTVPDTLVLDGQDPAQRQVLGLALPQQGDQGASATAERTGSAGYAQASGSGALLVTLSPPPGPLRPGMRIVFTTQQANDSAATLTVNGQGPIPLRKHITAALDSADIPAGVPTEVIYDGAVFQVVSQVYPGCPAGMHPVGAHGCVEDSSRAALNWYAANTTCSNQGRRLCGFSEWIRACQQQSSILGSVLDYEWVDEAANSNNTAKTMGINETTLLPDCRAGGHKLPTETSRFRCCSDR